MSASVNIYFQLRLPDMCKNSMNFRTLGDRINRCLLQSISMKSLANLQLIPQISIPVTKLKVTSKISKRDFTRIVLICFLSLLKITAYRIISIQQVGIIHVLVTVPLLLETGPLGPVSSKAMYLLTRRYVAGWLCGVFTSSRCNHGNSLVHKIL